MSTLCEAGQVLRSLIEEGQTLANQSEQVVALYMTTSGCLEVDVKGSLEQYERILEVFYPQADNDSWQLGLA